MAEAGVSNANESNLPEKGRVTKVSQKWRVFEDGVIAHQMQNDEFDYKKGLNRFNRRTVRDDIPVAKVVHTEEEKQAQREHLQHLERQKQIADRDAEVARKAQLEEQRRIELERLARAQEDALIATQFQTAEMIEAERAKVQMEMSDEHLAQKLQEKEKERFERKRMERQLAKQRKALQKEQAQTAGDVLAGRMETQEPPSQGFRDMSLSEQERILRVDGRVEDAGDFSDFYIQPSEDMDPQETKELRELQDEELARLLQDQEKKRGASVDKDKMKQIEEKDAEIARLIYEQEKLKVKKHRQKYHKQLSQPVGSGRGPDQHIHRTGSVPHHNHPHNPENLHNERLELRTGRVVIEVDNVHSPPQQYLVSQQHSPGSQNSDDRELPPYRPPPPISAHQRRTAEDHGGPHSGSTTPPYSRPPVPPHMMPDYAEYASRPLPETPHSPGVHHSGDASRIYANTGASPHGPMQRSPGSQSESSNVFTSLDPTFRDAGGPPHGHHGRPPQQVARSPPSATAVAGREPVEYADLNDMGAPVQNQKRSSLTRDKKKDKCKQQ